MLKQGDWIHFVGIGGVGMSGLAHILRTMGVSVSGSDLADNACTRRLAANGAQIFQGHSPEHLPEQTTTVVASTAVKGDNPELTEARKRGLNILHRSDVLAALMSLKKGISIAGAHGKTTTTAMLGLALQGAGLEPAIIVGGDVAALDGNAKWGKGDFCVAEADESDGSFLKLPTWMAIVTNIEGDHLDYYRSLDSIIDAFYQFMEKVPADGYLILCADDPQLAKMAQEEHQARVITYGLAQNAMYQARNVVQNADESQADIYRENQYLGTIKLKVPGVHNIINAVSVVAAADILGASFQNIKNTLADFRGVGRRFQTIGEARGVRVVDDYAHHPTEVKATLAAARQTKPRRVIGVFQPHRYTRTQALQKEFGAAFEDADVVIINEVYSAGEPQIPGVTSQLIVDAIEDNGGKNVNYIKEKEEIIDYLSKTAEPGDLVLTMGAGNIWTVGPQLIARLKEDN